MVSIERNSWPLGRRWPDVELALAGLVSQPCWRVAFTYGDELRLEFGPRVPSRVSRREYGEWSLGTRASNWQLRDAAGLLVSSDSPREEADERIKALHGVTVTGVDVTPEYGLVIQFEGGHRFEVWPDTREKDLSYWEMFVPGRQLLEVGPGDTMRIKKLD